jgi:hypothetical protein
MKVLRYPTAAGPDWWIVTHDLSLAEGKKRNLRLIHVFTFLNQARVTKHHDRMFTAAMSLENKLHAVRLYQIEVRKALAQVGDPVYRNKYVRDYDDEQRVICSLEAYLNAIYSALELAAQMNRVIYSTLPWSFAQQSKKCNCFYANGKDWLTRFQDLRAELTHFNSPLPLIFSRKLIVDFKRERQLRAFKKGRNEITFHELLKYDSELFDMLDAWALKELQHIDPEKEIASTEETGINTPLKLSKIKVKDVLDLLK